MSEMYVVKLVTDYELLIKNPPLSGLSKGDLLEVLDSRTQDVVDPLTHENLGSIDRSKARVVVEKVGETMCLCTSYDRTPGGGLSAVSRVLSGEPTISITGSTASWPEGVRPGDPVQATGRRLRPKSG